MIIAQAIKLIDIKMGRLEDEYKQAKRETKFSKAAAISYTIQILWELRDDIQAFNDMDKEECQKRLTDCSCVEWR